MTNRQAAVLASRIFCVWFIYNAAVNVTVLPEWVYILEQGTRFASNRIGSAVTAINQTALMNLLSALLRLGINVAAAIFCYRCGPGLIRFLTGGESDVDPANVETAT